jgi:N-methylhydantoinase B
VEIFESDTPLIVQERSLLRDSGGPGKMRGGLGRKFVIRIPDDEFAPVPPTTIAIQAGRFRYPPGGLFKGGSGSKAQFIVNNQAGDPSGLTLCDSGDVIQFHSAGGGGYGDPLARDPAAVEQDVINEYVSPEQARNSYGVVVDPETLKVDLEETEKLRASAKPKR